jgi:hypothetical protein
MNKQVVGLLQDLVVNVITHEQYYICTVAVNNGNGGWCAYRGIFPCNDRNELLDCDNPDLQIVVEYGTKLLVSDAREVFPFLLIGRYNK